MFSATDPEGRLIRLTQQDWQRHIIAHHPDAVPDWVQETIEAPQFITRSTIVNHRKELCRLCYYRIGILPRAYKDQYFKVVVRQVKRTKRFYVCTAFPAHYLKLQVEEIIWSTVSRSSSNAPT